MQNPLQCYYFTQRSTTERVACSFGFLFTLVTRWKVAIPGGHANLNVTVDAEDQELVTGGPRYEGSAAVTGTYGHRHVIGSTYIEVTASK
jgi:predicted secreted hydrolase